MVLEHQLKFLGHIVVTTLCPDIVLMSESIKQVVLLELTVLWEDHLKDVFERKLSMYAGLVSDFQEAGWRAGCLQVEVRYRGFTAHSLTSSLTSIQGSEKVEGHLQYHQCNRAGFTMAVDEKRRTMR